MRKRFFTVLICLIALCLSSFAQHKKSGRKANAASGPLPDKALMQKIWDGWSTLDPSNVAQYYAKGDHPFFDIAPLKYNSWEEYQTGVVKVLAGFKSAKFTVNDDVQIHPHGDLVWATSTVKEDATMKAGNKHEMATIRWTVIWEKVNGNWLIVHEHISEPLQ
ncbi:MAG: hypothetical protein DMG74_15240 [Acidobacteria bacterium]|jgi:ketosteroid isomerase-like protein|nr:MAG: hypothetical protein DMG74_15240 [Acidobacteriota bacterium]